MAVGKVALWMRWSSRSSCLLGCARPCFQLRLLRRENASLLPDPRSHAGIGAVMSEGNAPRAMLGTVLAVNSLL